MLCISVDGKVGSDGYAKRITRLSTRGATSVKRLGYGGANARKGGDQEVSPNLIRRKKNAHKHGGNHRGRVRGSTLDHGGRNGLVTRFTV